MSFTFTTIREKSNSDGEESKSDDGSEADEHDNIFIRKTNMMSDEEVEQNDDNGGAGIVNEWAWEKIPDDLVIPGIPDHYSGPK
eukprot:13229804-Ditylum_brightwellii.AAC.1